MFGNTSFKSNVFENAPKFSSPQEEIDFLKSQIEQKEKMLASLETTPSKQEIARTLVHEYSKEEAENLLHKAHPYYADRERGVSLPLSPEKDDEKIAELLGIMMEQGVFKALEVLKGLHSPHLEDDFHRFLVQYLLFGIDTQDIKKYKSLYKDLDTVLFEVVLPEAEGGKSFKEVASLMEQLYVGMIGIGGDGKDKNYFSLEVGLGNGTNEVVFFASIPRRFRDLFEKQLLSLFPKAVLLEQKDDYNVFNDTGFSLASYAKFKEYKGLPLKLYTEFEQDPMTVVLNAFSKIKKDGEGVALQFVIAPSGSAYVKEFGKTIDEMRKGKKLGDFSSGGSFEWKDVSDGITTFFGGKASSGPSKEKTTTHADEDHMRLIGEKISSIIMEANIRIIVSANSKARAEAILSEVEGAFMQFTEPKGNSLTFVRPEGKNLETLFRKFSYRNFSPEEVLPLNIKELTSLYHYPIGLKDFSQLKQSDFTQASAPLDLGTEGTLLGVNRYRHLEQDVYLGKEDRVRHFYVIGQTGTGKTTILKNMIVQDIKAGHGCCFIDPHGYDIEDILANIPPERMDDVIYFDPGNQDRVMGLNMLEFDPAHPEQKSNVVDELLSIFNKLFDMKTAGGPAFEQYFRNAAFTVMAHPESGNTLLEIGRVMADKAYRDMKLSHTTNPLLLQFWKNAESTTGESGLSNYVPYITNKFDVFLSNDYMRPIVTQEKSAFNFREIMDNKKIFLANLSKGKLGDINSSLLGLIIVGKITIAALSRPANISPDFYLYIDEFQNFTTPSITTILSEARKYRLSLNLAHQYIGQLPEDIKGAIFGNVGSMAIFRVGVEDAEFLEKYFKPTFTATDIFKLPNRTAYVKMLSNGNPQKPFNIVTMAPEKGNRELIAPLKELSAVSFGRNKRDVEEEMMKKYLKK
jgi:hypothetical protein